MADASDQSAMQAWMIAIPSAVTAISTWYVSRNNKKTTDNSDVKTKKVVTDTSFDLAKQIKKLEEKIKTLEEASQRERELASQERSAQIEQSMKYTEAMDVLNIELQAAKTAFQKMRIDRTLTSLDHPTIETDEEIPTENKHGKVIRKP